MTSTAPLRTGDGRAVDLTLTPLAGGVLRPVAAPFYLAADLDVAAGFTVGAKGATAFGVTPLGVSEQARFTESGDVLVAAGTHIDTDTVMRPTPAGLSSFEVLHSEDAPVEFRYKLELKPGQSAVQDGGTVLVRSGERPEAVITAPAAMDAAGRPVAIELALDGLELVLRVDHRGRGYAYPVLADPEFGTSYDWDNATTGNEGWFVDTETDAGFYDVSIVDPPDPGIRIRPKTGQVFPGGVLGSMLWQAPGTARISSVTFQNVFRQNDSARQTGRLQLTDGQTDVNNDHFNAGPGVVGDVTLDDADPVTPTSRWAAVKLFTPPCAPMEPNCPKVVPNGNLSVIKVGSVSITLVDNEPPTTGATGPLRDLADQWTHGDQPASVDLVASDSGLGVKSWEFSVTDTDGTHLLDSGAPTCDNTHHTAGQGSNICPAEVKQQGVGVDLAQLKEGAQKFRLAATDLVDQTSDEGGSSTEWTTFIDRTPPTIDTTGPLAEAANTWITPQALDARVRLKAADQISGVKSTRLKVADTDGKQLADETTGTCTPQGPVAQPCPNQYEHEVTLDPDTLPEGKLAFTATATDFTSLTSLEKQWSVFLDRTPPIGRASGDLVALTDQWTKESGTVSLTVNGRDRLSGVHKIALQVKNADGYQTLGEVQTCNKPEDKNPQDGSCPHLTSNELAVDTAALPDGKNQFLIAAWDQAGHKSRDTDTWDTYIDHTPPPTPTGLKTTNNGTTAAVVTWNPVQDLPEGSPGVSYEYAVIAEGQEFITWISTPYPAALITQPSPGKVQTVKVRAIDKVGLVSRAIELQVAGVTSRVTPPRRPDHTQKRCAGQSPCAPWELDDSIATATYARRYATTPNPGYARFPNDCTNFVSQTLARRQVHIGGQNRTTGMAMIDSREGTSDNNSWWRDGGQRCLPGSNTCKNGYAHTISWINVEGFYTHMVTRSQRMENLGQLPAGQMRIADVIVLNWDNGGPTKDHLAIVTADSSNNHRYGHVQNGDAFVSQHTAERNNVSWTRDYLRAVDRNVRAGHAGRRWSYFVLRPRWKVANP